MRHDASDKLKHLEKEKEIGEDDHKRAGEQLEKLTHRMVEEAERTESGFTLLIDGASNVEYLSSADQAAAEADHRPEARHPAPGEFEREASALRKSQQGDPLGR